MSIKLKKMMNIGMLLIPISFLWSSDSKALQFRYHYQPSQKLNVVVAEGVIQHGDDQKFLRFSQNAGRDRFGNIVLVLNSEGGDVDAAFAMSKAMDRLSVTTIVPDNAVCASACASILYISGNLRGVLGTGVLGFHSCYTVNRIGSVVKSHNEQCNVSIGTNAFDHGVDYGLVDAWTEEYGPDKMAYLDAKLACHIGLCSKEIVPSSRTSQEFIQELARKFSSKSKK